MVSSPGKGAAIASMVLGICSLVLPFLGVITAIIGLILGIVGASRQKSTGASAGMAVAGIVCSVVALAVSIIYIVACYEIWDSLFSGRGYFGDLTDWFDWY